MQAGTQQIQSVSEVQSMVSETIVPVDTAIEITSRAAMKTQLMVDAAGLIQDAAGN
jgi:hypothetical protein